MNPKYDTLFYDGSCPLCAKEIRTLRRLQRGQLIFADIHEQPEGSPQLPSHEDLLRRLHLMTWTGRLRPFAISLETRSIRKARKEISSAVAVNK
jgi:predicted DCC family thiol-disulfide oxidoreductase YuxK